MQEPEPVKRRRRRAADGGGVRRWPVLIRLNDDEWEVVQLAAQESGSAVGAWIGEHAVTAARNALAGGAPVVTEVDQEAMLKIVSTRGHLAAIGNNVNQMAAWGNSGQFPPAAQAEALYADIRRAVDALDDAAGRIRGRRT